MYGLEYVENDSKLLNYVLDGWDEAPACLRNPPDPKCPPDNSYLGKLLRIQVSIQHYHPHHLSTRLLTGPTQHEPMLTEWRFRCGFTKESIHDYFQEALSTQLSC